MTGTIKIMATLTAHPGMEADLRALIHGMIGPSRAEPGNLRYDLWQDQADPARYVIDELYADQAAVTAHRASDHFRHFAATIESVAQRQSLVLIGIDLA